MLFLLLLHLLFPFLSLLFPCCGLRISEELRKLSRLISPLGSICLTCLTKIMFCPPAISKCFFVFFFSVGAITIVCLHAHYNTNSLPILKLIKVTHCVNDINYFGLTEAFSVSGILFKIFFLCLLLTTNKLHQLRQNQVQGLLSTLLDGL